jgi:acyl-CoA synthetase (AMP-forming)/AMP-acid ligase II
MTLPGTLEALMAQAPTASAIIVQRAGQDDLTLSRADLWAGAEPWAAVLAGARGRVVLLILEHGPALPLAFWGALRAGAIPSILPFLTEKLDPGKYRRDLSALLAVIGPAAIVTYAGFADEVRSAVAGSDVRVWLAEADGRPQGDDARARAGAGAVAASAPDPDAIALLQHSSGTTGLQKGIALSHAAIHRQLTAYTQTLQVRADDVVVSWLPLYHDMGLIAGFLLPLLSGIPLVWSSPFDWVRAPHRLLQSVSHYRGTLSWLPNFAYNFLAQKVRERDLEGLTLSRWRAVINCSEPTRVDSQAQFLARYQPYGLRPEALATCYAMAENVFAVSQTPLAQVARIDHVDAVAFRDRHRAVPGTDLALLSAGRPLPNVEVRVLAEDRTPLAEREVGEIALRSDCMLSGFYNRPELGAEVFHQGWYLTGDLGYLAEGELFVTGRKKDLIIVGGKNVYPGDLEALAGGLEGVIPGRVVAFGIPDERAGTEEAVVIAESELTDLDARRALADTIRAAVTRGSDIALRRVEIMPPRWLLKTSSGKIARGANREKLLRGE